MIILIMISIKMLVEIDNKPTQDIVYPEYEYTVSSTYYDCKPPEYEIKTLRNPQISYLEKCVQAEAGNQDELGRAYVCDVILNRLDSGRWGNSLYEVIYYPRAFSVVSNGTIDRVVVTDETKRIVEKELQERTNNEILAFKTESYHENTTPCFQHGAHYFSK